MQTTKGIVISLFDYTGEAVKPWARNGYHCLCFDLQHGEAGDVSLFGNGVIEKLHWDSDGAGYAGFYAAQDAVKRVRAHYGRLVPVVFVYGFPPCTDLAGSGARHWAGKLAADPGCQERAARRARLCQMVADVFSAPFAIENPQGALGRLWRKHDHSFNPCDFGGYIAADDAEHPTWAEYIAPRDAYKKRTLLWTGNGFVMPERDAVAPEIVVVGDKQGSRQWAKLGGKSIKTKNIRSATPRGFAIAVMHANRPTRDTVVDFASTLAGYGLSLS